LATQEFLRLSRLMIKGQLANPEGLHVHSHQTGVHECY